MIVAYLVPVTPALGFSTCVAETTRREVWCRYCTTPCDKTIPVPADHIGINDYQVGPGYDTCAVCGKRITTAELENKTEDYHKFA